MLFLFLCDPVNMYSAVAFELIKKTYHHICLCCDILPLLYIKELCIGMLGFVLFELIFRL